ncbi:unnamed protein product, partial [Polarella glacialis]
EAPLPPLRQTRMSQPDEGVSLQQVRQSYETQLEELRSELERELRRNQDLRRRNT